MSHKTKSYIYVSLAVLLWSTTAGVSKLVLKNLNNLQVLFYASFIATVSLFIIVLIQKKTKVIRKYKIRDYKNFAFMGFIGVFLYYIFLYGAFMHSSAQEAFIVNYTWPIWVFIFAMILLREKLSAKKIIAIILGFIGVYIVITKGDFLILPLSNLQGNLLALAGAISYGIFSVLGKKFDYERITSMTFYYLFTFIYIFIVTILFSKIPLVTLSQLAGLLWLGIFTSGLAFVFWFLALKFGEITKMSNIVFITPFLSLVFIYFLTGERILYSSVVGLFFIIVGIVLQNSNIRLRPRRVGETLGK